MALSFRVFQDGIRLEGSTNPDTVGEIAYVGGELKYFGTALRTVVNTNTAQTLSTKTLDNTNTVTLLDTLFTLQDNIDPTRQARFDVTNVTAGQIRVFSFPDYDAQLATLAGAETLTNKTIVVASNTVTTAPNGNLTSTELNAALAELQADVDTRALDSSLTAHLNDTTDAHDASAISNVPSGNLAATDVQGALDELQSDVDTRALDSSLTSHITDTVDAHDASAISNIPSGNLAATDVQGALNELQTDVDTRALNSDLITHTGDTSNPHSVTKIQVGLGNVTDDAQLKRAANDWAGFTEKTLVADADLVLIEDSADSGNKKKVQMSNLGGGSGTGEENIFSTHVSKGEAITGFNGFVDAAGPYPVYGTGGVPSGNFNISTSGGKIHLVKTGYVNLQGEGKSIDLTVLDEQKGKVVAFRMDYRILSGTYADKSLIVWAINPADNSPIPIQPSQIQNHTLTSEAFYGEMQLPETITTVRFCFYIAGTDTNNYDMTVDNLILGRTEQRNGTIRGPIGSIIAFPSKTPPFGYLYCDGQAVSRTQYAKLFSVIGTTHGQGDGSTTFNVPDYRGRFIRGLSDGTGRDPDAGSRTAMNTGGATGDNIGSIQGDQYRSHNHGVNDPGHNHQIGTSVYNPPGLYANFGRNDVAAYPNFGYTSGSTTGVTIQNSGGNETRPLNANVAYHICFDAGDVLLSSETDTRVFNEHIWRSSFSTSAGTIFYPGATWSAYDSTHGGAQSDGKIYVKSTGRYQISSFADTGVASGNVIFSYRINGSGDVFFGGKGTSDRTSVISRPIVLYAGQYIQVGVYNNANETINYLDWSLTKWGGSSQIAASESIYSHYKWNTWNPVDLSGTTTNAPNSGTAVGSGQITLANTSGTLTMTFNSSGTYLISPDTDFTCSAPYGFSRMFMHYGGTAQRLSTNASSFATGIEAQDANYGNCKTFLVRALQGQTFTMLPTLEVATGSSTSNYVGYASVSVTRIGQY